VAFTHPTLKLVIFFSLSHNSSTFSSFYFVLKKMGYSKTFLLFGLVLLLISSHVLARELAETAQTQTAETDKDHHHDKKHEHHKHHDDHKHEHHKHHHGGKGAADGTEEDEN
ncbi:hypothetical protein CFOL_v3_31610, partial [Cephalotus follicularis]